MINQTSLVRKEVRGFRLIFGYLGTFLSLIGLIILAPLLLLFFYPEESDCWYLFVIPGAIYIVIGLLLYFSLIYRKDKAHFARFENSQLLILVWLMAVIAGALPFYLATVFGKMDMSVSESIFEAASAYSTTGLSAFRDFVDSEGAFCPHIYTFHRSFMQFIGGIGLVLLLESFLGYSSTSLYTTEGHSDKLLPSIGKSARLLFGIYLGYTLIGSLALWLAGMNVFDAVNHSMCALSGGGMSTHADNIAYFNASPGNGILPSNPIAIEIIIMFLVILSGISFLLHTYLLTFKWKKFFKDDEIKFALTLMLFGSVTMMFYGAYSLMQKMGGSYWSHFGDSARMSVFYVVGSATTSGFSNTSLDDMLNLGKPLLWVCTLLMIIGGGAGSCGGGIKQYRVFICVKNLWYSLKYKFSPTHQINPKETYRYGKMTQLSDETVKEAYTYSMLFLVVFVISVFILTFLPGFSSEYAAFDVASGMSNTGLSVTDFVAYGRAHPVAQKIALWVLSIGMILGRLEIFPLIFAGRNVREEFAYQKNLKRLAKEAEEREEKEEDLFGDDDL